MPERQCDTLILGQGLAGSALAWELIAAGRRVCVVDDGHRSSASAVAGGLINPLAGLRFTRRPELEDWLSGAERWYARLADRFGRRFLHPLPMLRLFRSPEQRRFYDRRLGDPDSTRLLGNAFTADDCPEAVAAPYGGFRQQRTGYVDLPMLLATMRGWLRDHQALVEGALEPGRVEIGPAGVKALGIRAARLIFCEGARLELNPWFRDLPLQPEKGEILDLVAVDWHPSHIVNGAHWLLPLPSGILRFGATHEHHRVDTRITEAGRAELLEGMRLLRPTAPPPRVVGQRAGIRPGTTDRYPLIGQHPGEPRLWVFNGFGARGGLTIPWYAERLRAHLERGEPLPAEADIRRFT
jgi:glycine/D-amino acid oxidase-like deaminating enzyme